MNQLNPSVKSLFDVLAFEIQARLLKGDTGDARISWGDDGADRSSADLIWWSWSLSIDSTSSLLAGASLATWQKVCGLDAEVTPGDFGVESLAPLTAIIQEMAWSKFGTEVTCSGGGRSQEPLREWTSAVCAIESAPGTDMSLHFSLSPDLEAALGGSTADTEGSEDQDVARQVPLNRNSAAILMHVEMPVTIVLGRTKMRLKDLLKLTNGSVVELDQALDDEVEIRVNNCVIAYGQVVAVDGNYAVRVLRMAPTRNTSDLSETLSEKAA